MYDVILFGGTYEGHKIADFLSDKNVSYIVCVATEYGGEVLSNKNVRVGRMTADEMRAFFSENSAKIIVDATHPYADKVTENIKAACTCRYIRVAREGVDTVGTHFKDMSAAAEYLRKTEGNILLTTGSKEIALFSALTDRMYARVLPSAEAIEACRSAGLQMKNIICMQGPFSKKFNIALIRELDVKYLVTKNGGKSGGFTEKIEAARETGTECIIIDRPLNEEGVSVEDAEKLILEWL